MTTPGGKSGFTLIELSIVLVIIGLIIGGVLVGQNLVTAATTRAQITQIEKYNSAVNTFKNKYGGIPGDLALADANTFGFVSGSGCVGQSGGRDGNGTLDGWIAPSLIQAEGEVAIFWQDLGQVGFIDNQYPNSGAAAITCNAAGAAVTSLTIGTSYVGDYFPAAKLGMNNFLYVYELSGINWFGIMAITSTAPGGRIAASTNIPVTIAYNIDKKVDDGLPITGNVQAVYINNSFAVAGAPSNNPDSISTCYNSSTLGYSTNVSNGSGPNCALSFRMQGAAR